MKRRNDAQALTHRPVELAIIGGGAAGLFAAATAGKSAAASKNPSSAKKPAAKPKSVKARYAKRG